ncbi:AbrB/MazE/SpoVT family DNA-binding domain-containing protein [Candidatus Roizmanbacteria bacterium]|nr:AbrB/MazE/SpoVT family DNA-binding domain-containing protein [Candidatus Roizmanbacteria bacterium]
MLQTVKISSKRQVTIPVDIFKYLSLNEGDRLVVNIDEGKIVMEKSQKILDEIAGSLILPKKYKNKPLDYIIRDSKQEYFAVKK